MNANIYLEDDDDDIFHAVDILDKKKKRKGYYLYKVLWDDGSTSWEPAKNLSSDWLCQYEDENKFSKSESEVYNSSKKKKECLKIYANDWFISEVAKTNYDVNNILILDGPDLNTTKRLLGNSVLESRIKQIYIPNKYSVVAMKCLLKNDPQLINKINHYDTDAGKLIKYLAKNEPDTKFTGVWLDYTGSLSGNKSKKIHPLKDIRKLFTAQQLNTGSVFAVTWNTRKEPLSLKKAAQKIQNIIEDSGYTTHNLCVEKKLSCSENYTIETTCDNDGVFVYGHANQMKMIMFQCYIGETKNLEQEQNYISHIIEFNETKNKYLVQLKPKPGRSRGNRVWKIPEDVPDSIILEYQNTSFVIEKIVNVRENSQTETFEYLVKWKNYASSENSWEPAENISKELLLEFVMK